MGKNLRRVVSPETVDPAVASVIRSESKTYLEGFNKLAHRIRLLVEQIQMLTEQNRALRAEAEEARTEFEGIKESRMWRLTAPLRRKIRFLQGHRY